MKVSIVTVARNSAATIGDTLASVAGQSHPDIEHIVVDGASSDATLDVVRTCGAHAAQVVSEPDRGIYDAMNKGLALATGEFVGFLNADDMLADTQAVARLAHAASGGDADAVYGDLCYVSQQPPHAPIRYWRSGAFAPSRLRFGWMPPHPTFYVRRSELVEVGGFADDLRIAADYDFMLRWLARPGVTVAYVPHVLVHMRTGGASNRSLKALLRKSREDLTALRRNDVGGVASLLAKNARKLPQFLRRPPT
jgi:glycosyltransferase